MQNEIAASAPSKAYLVNPKVNRERNTGYEQLCSNTGYFLEH